MPSYSQTLLCGRTTLGLNIPWACGADGDLNGTTVNPTVDVGPASLVLAFGRTAAGENRPILVDADGVVQFA